MDQYLAASAIFLIQAVFGLYILAVLLRLLLQLMRADFYNPISQFVVRITNPVLRPLRRLIPGWGGIDLASLLLLIVLQIVELVLINLALGHMVSGIELLVTAAAELLELTLNVYIVAIIVQVIVSWVSPGNYHPLTALAYRFADPLLAPVRRILPSIGNIDLSPLVVVVVLQLAKILVVAPIADLALHLS